jgi:hypothetical protein
MQVKWLREVLRLLQRTMDLEKMVEEKGIEPSTFALRRLLHPQIGSLGPRLEGRKGLNGCISAYQQHEPDTCRYG